MEEDPLGGEGEVTRGHPRRQNVVARSRLRGEAARLCRSGNFRNPRGWVCTGSLTGDLGLSSPGSGRGMTSPDQALIGRRSQQVGAAWTRSPQPARKGLRRKDPHDPSSRGSPMGTVRPRGRPHARGEGGKVRRGVPAKVHRAVGPTTLRALGSGAHGPLRGRPAGAGERRGVRARARGGAGCCVGRAGARTLTRAPSVPQRPDTQLLVGCS